MTVVSLTLAVRVCNVLLYGQCQRTFAGTIRTRSICWSDYDVEDVTYRLSYNRYTKKDVQFLGGERQGILDFIYKSWVWHNHIGLLQMSLLNVTTYTELNATFMLTRRL